MSNNPSLHSHHHFDHDHNNNPDACHVMDVTDGSGADVFHLQDAMAATQLLDPKLDGCQIPISGYVVPTTTAATTTTTQNDTTTTINDERMVYPRPIPTGLRDDPYHSLPWDDLTITDTTVICLETLWRFQSFCSGSAVAESTFTCLYAHAAVLADMQRQLIVPTFSSSNASASKIPHNATATAVLEELIQQITIDDHPSNNTAATTSTVTNFTSQLLALQWSVFAATYAMVDLTDMIREIILNADIYEEEDFVVPTHDIPFYPSLLAVHHPLPPTRNESAAAKSHPNDASCDDDNEHDHDSMDSIHILKTAIRYIENVNVTRPEETGNVDDSIHCLQIIGDILRYEFHMIQILPILARLHSGSDLTDTVESIQTIVQTAVQRLNRIQENMIKARFVVDEKINGSDDPIDNDQKSVSHTNDHETIYHRPSIQRTIQRSFDSYVLRPYVGNIPLRKIKIVSQPLQSIHWLRTMTTQLDTTVCGTIVSRRPRGSSSRPDQQNNNNNNDYHHHRHTTLNRIYRMLDHIHDTNILGRSILLLNLYFDDKIFGQYDLRDLISATVQQQILCNGTVSLHDAAPSQLDHTDSTNVANPEFTEDTIVFLNRLAKPIYDTMKVRFLHRHRQRAYIEMVILPEWKSLYKEAQIFDLHYTNQQQQRRRRGKTTTANGVGDVEKESDIYFTQYVLTTLIQFMDRYIECGIEVGLFRNIIHDITFNNWYRDYLLSALHVQLSSKLQPTSQQIPVTTATIPNTKVNKTSTVHKETKSKLGNKKKNHQHTKNGKHLSDETRVGSTTSALATAPTAPTDRSMMPEKCEDMYELKVISLKRHLCRKTMQYISLLRKVAVIVEPTFEFTSLSRIFEKRFEIFRSIRQPPPLLYEDYLNGIDASSISVFELIQIVSDGYKYCRTMIEEMINTILDQNIDAFYVTMSMSELRSLMKVCVGNMVYVQRLRQILEKKYDSTSLSSSTSVTTENAKATFDFDSHCQFCIIKIEEVNS